MTLLSRLKTPVYKNTGSVARDHLAAERTFLAWIRTGLGFIALGTAIERFSRLDLETLLQQVPPSPPAPAAAASTPSPPSRHRRGPDDAAVTSSSSSDRGSSKHQEHLLAASLLGTGAGCIAYSIGRYYSNMRLLERGLFKPSYAGAGALGLTVAGVATAVYWAGFRKHRSNQ